MVGVKLIPGVIGTVLPIGYNEVPFVVPQGEARISLGMDLDRIKMGSNTNNAIYYSLHPKL
jgi:hypothetical protein